MPDRHVITSLTGVIAPLLTVATVDPQKVKMHSLFEPRIWKKVTPFVKDQYHITPVGPSGMNIEMAFEIPKFAHLISDICVHKNSPTHTIAPIGNPAYYVDHLGYADLDQFQVNYASNQNLTIDPYDLYFKYRKKYRTEPRDAIDDLILGDKTIAQRTAALVNGFDTLTSLMMDFQEHESQNFPLLTIAQKLRLLYKSKTFLNIIDLPVAGTTVTANGPYTYELICELVHLTGNEAELLLDMSRQDTGITYMIHQHIRQTSDLFTNNTTNATMVTKLSNFTRPLKWIMWAFVPDRLTNNTGFNDFFMFAPQPTPLPPGMNPYNPILNWRIDANGLIIQRQLLRDYNRVYMHYHYFEAPHGDEIFWQTYADYPMSVNAATGYLDYNNLSNPTLTVTFGVGGTGVDPVNPQVAQTLRLIINAQDYNFWYFCRGNMSRAFN